MPGAPKWTADELDLMFKYFDKPTNTTEMTLYRKLQNLNSQRSYEAMTRQLRRMRAKGWTRKTDDALRRLRVGYLDIEATHLKANFGFILSWYIKARDRNHYDFAVITKAEIDSHKFDRRVVSELLEALNNYDVVYTHWGADRRFDLPYIRTRALMHNMADRLPMKGEKFIMDTWPIAKNKLCLHSNRLDVIAEACGIRNVKKTVLSGEKWVLAAHGDAKSLEYIADHNKKDVQILERVHKKLEHFERPIYRSM